MQAYRYLSVCFSLLISFNSFSALTVDQIQEAIKTKGAKWTAKKTRQFGQSESQKQRYLGAILAEAPESTIEFKNINETLIDDLPDAVDWRNIKGMNFVSSVRDQGRCGSCVAFAAIATMETQFNIVNKLPYLDLNFSEQHLWSCDGGGCKRGWRPGSAARALRDNGTTDEACFPYKSGASGQAFKCEMTCESNDQRIYKISDYDNVSGWFGNNQAIMKALTKGPLLVSMKVYEDFLAYESGIYEHVTGKKLGGHAISMVGYNKKEKYWIVKNSWGTDWGEKGFFRIKMGDSGMGPNSYQLEMEPLAGTAKILSPKLGDVLQGSVKIELASSLKETVSMQLEVKANGSTNYLPVKYENNTYTVELNTVDLADGIYELRAVANVKEGDEKFYSPVKQMFILNKKPTLSIKVDKPKSTAKGKVTFTAEISAKPIPVQLVTLFIKDKNGEISKRTNTVPGEKTEINLKTEKFENGDYEIWLEARIAEHKIESEIFKISIKN